MFSRNSYHVWCFMYNSGFLSRCAVYNSSYTNQECTKISHVSFIAIRRSFLPTSPLLWTCKWPYIFLRIRYMFFHDHSVPQITANFIVCHPQHYFLQSISDISSYIFWYYSVFRMYSFSYIIVIFNNVMKLKDKSRI